MKKLITSIMIGVLLLLLTGCSRGANNVDHYGLEASTLGYKNLSEMQEASNAIVKVTKTEDEIPVVKTENGRMVSGYTLSQVIVEEIYKDSSDSIQKGDSLRVLENEVYNKDEKVVYHIAGYNMMEPGKEYLLFLTKHTYTDGKPYFVSLGVNYGTISLNEDDRNEIRSNRMGYPVNDFSNFEDLWETAKEEYIK